MAWRQNIIKSNTNPDKVVISDSFIIRLIQKRLLTVILITVAFAVNSAAQAARS